MKVLVIHGPNLNLLGTRETRHYGKSTLSDINASLKADAKRSGVSLEIVQSNQEGDLVDAVQKAANGGIDGILINPAAYGHTSIALRDSLIATGIPFVEVHISNIYARESFRQETYLSDIASGVVVGFGAASYNLGLTGLVDMLSANK